MMKDTERMQTAESRTTRSKTARMGSLLFAAALMLGACGSSSSDSDESGLESSTETTAAVEETTTTETAETVEEETTTTTAEVVEEETTTTVAEAETDETSLLDGITPEEKAILLEELAMTEAEFGQFEMLLNTEAGQQLMAEGIVESSDLTMEQAMCVIGNGDILGLMMVGFAGDDADVDSELMVSFLETLETCDIPLSQFGG